MRNGTLPVGKSRLTWPQLQASLYMLNLVIKTTQLGIDIHTFHWPFEIYCRTWGYKCVMISRCRYTQLIYIYTFTYIYIYIYMYIYIYTPQCTILLYYVPCMEEQWQTMPFAWHPSGPARRTSCVRMPRRILVPICGSSDLVLGWPVTAPVTNNGFKYYCNRYPLVI